MQKYSFNYWLKKRINEYADFGLGQYFQEPTKPVIDDGNPTKPFNLEYVINSLKKYPLGIKEVVRDDFISDAQWGKGPGAIRVNFGPYGGLRATVQKLNTDLQGEKVWIDKKVLEVTDYYEKHPDAIIADLFNLVTETDKTDLDTPSNTYEDLEDLVVTMADTLKRKTIQHTLVFEGVRKIKNNEDYIIHFGCTGMGRQRQDQKRLDQFEVHVTYDKDRGIIKVSGTEIGDFIGKHSWRLDPSEFLDNFMPSQSKQEIIECVLAHLNAY